MHILPGTNFLWRLDSDAVDATIPNHHRQYKQADRAQGELMNGMSKQGELIKTMAEHCPAIVHGFNGASVILAHTFDCVFYIADAFLNFTGSLFSDAFGLLLFVPCQFARLFLDFAGSIFNATFDLVFVHGSSSK
jgi:hypothetical protein